MSTHTTPSKLLLVGDIHIKRDNLYMINLFRNRLLEHLTKHRYDAIVILGDVLHYHEKIFIQSMETATQLFQDIVRVGDCPLYVLVGNHDMTHDLASHWMSSVAHLSHRIIIVDKPMAVGSILMAPYTHAGDFWNMVGDTFGSHITTLLAHQEFKGAKMGAFLSTTGDEHDHLSPTQMIFSGHIHDHQKVGDHVVYIGSALQHGFGDVENKMLVELSVPSNQWTPVYLDLPKRRVVRMRVADVPTLSIHRNDFYKIIVMGTTTEWNQFKKSKHYKSLASNSQVVIYHELVLIDSVGAVVATAPKTVPDFYSECVRRLGDDDAVVDLFKSVVVCAAGAASN